MYIKFYIASSLKLIRYSSMSKVHIYMYMDICTYLSMCALVRTVFSESNWAILSFNFLCKYMYMYIMYSYHTESTSLILNKDVVQKKQTHDIYEGFSVQ